MEVVLLIVYTVLQAFMGYSYRTLVGGLASGDTCASAKRTTSSSIASILRSTFIEKEPHATKNAVSNQIANSMS